MGGLSGLRHFRDFGKKNFAEGAKIWADGLQRPPHLGQSRRAEMTIKPRRRDYWCLKLVLKPTLLGLTVEKKFKDLFIDRQRNPNQFS